MKPDDESLMADLRRALPIYYPDRAEKMLKRIEEQFTRPLVESHLNMRVLNGQAGKPLGVRSAATPDVPGELSLVIHADDLKFEAVMVIRSVEIAEDYRDDYMGAGDLRQVRLTLEGEAKHGVQRTIKDPPPQPTIKINAPPVPQEGSDEYRALLAHVERQVRVDHTRPRGKRGGKKK